MKFLANAQISCVARTLVRGEANAARLLLYELAVAGEHLVSGLKRAAEVAAGPGPGAGHGAAEGAAAYDARWADTQADAQTGQAFATHKSNKCATVRHAGVIRSHGGCGEGGEQGDD